MGTMYTRQRLREMETMDEVPSKEGGKVTKGSRPFYTHIELGIGTGKRRQVVDSVHHLFVRASQAKWDSGFMVRGTHDAMPNNFYPPLFFPSLLD